ncbi:Aspartyl/glutamyl-tRNA amidotransferase subunit B [Paraphysoderma sedebokerense]|nr:Aspartyl/glutamyl-tRNA amidotransferase subunit B [Paraphysoderma sedebokerense]
MDEASSTSYQSSPPNTNVSVFDAAFPGTLPTLNEEAVTLALRTAIALNARINKVSWFDRKHYFYPDLPGGYQITQKYAPLASDGFIKLSSFELPELQKDLVVRIEQIQLEQDTGKSYHDVHPEYSLIDLNRAGMGLMEIVTKPDIRSASQAAAVLKLLQSTLRAVGSSEANLELGSLRCDVNVSVRKLKADAQTAEVDGNHTNEMGVKTEIKNVNSVRSLTLGIEYEINRQIQALESGETLHSETRGFDVKTNSTFPLRSKEETKDYRYMFEPDLPKIWISEGTIAELKSSNPELPQQKAMRILETYQGVTNDQVRVLMDEPGGVKYFEEAVTGAKKLQKKDVCGIVNWITTELVGRLHERQLTLESSVVTSTQLASIVQRINNGDISGKIAKRILDIMISPALLSDEEVKQLPNYPSAYDIAKLKKWEVIRNVEDIERIVTEIIVSVPDKVAAAKKNPRLVGWFVGQVMEQTDSLADPAVSMKVVKDALDRLA